MDDPVPELRVAGDLLICNACGTQFAVSSGKDACRICDDPRQFVPPEGQTFTTLDILWRRGGAKNVWRKDKVNEKIWAVRTEPKFAIGQRAMLIQTRAGNILWDLVSLLDLETVKHITSLGGLRAIVISHPHYYATWADWARTFGCPVYVGAPDKEWLERVDTPGAELRFLTEEHTPILEGSGATAILAGGHFPGSLLLHWDGNLFIADTIFTSPSAMNPVPGKAGVTSFGFYWSIPNHIPLHPDGVLRIWRSVKGLEFHSAFGAFEGMDVRTRENERTRATGEVKGRLLQSCKIYVGAVGWEKHGMLEEGMGE